VTLHDLRHSLRIRYSLISGQMLVQVSGKSCGQMKASCCVCQAWGLLVEGAITQAATEATLEGTRNLWLVRVASGTWSVRAEVVVQVGLADTIRSLR
jgi:hypothetical protein